MLLFSSIADLAAVNFKFTVVGVVNLNEYFVEAVILSLLFTAEVLQVPVYCCQGAYDNRVDQEIS